MLEHRYQDMQNHLCGRIGKDQSRLHLDLQGVRIHAEEVETWCQVLGALRYGTFVFIEIQLRAKITPTRVTRFVSAQTNHSDTGYEIQSTTDTLKRVDVNGKIERTTISTHSEITLSDVREHTRLILSPTQFLGKAMG